MDQTETMQQCWTTISRKIFKESSVSEQLDNFEVAHCTGNWNRSVQTSPRDHAAFRERERLRKVIENDGGHVEVRK